LLAEVELAAGNQGLALEHAGQAHQIAAKMGNLEGQAVSARVMARLLAQADRPAEARHSFEESLQLLIQSGNQIELARTHYELGIWLVQDKSQLAEAKEQLRRAASLFTAAGAETEAARTYSLLNKEEPANVYSPNNVE
jgi:hypothetical protein